MNHWNVAQIQIIVGKMFIFSQCLCVNACVLLHFLFVRWSGVICVLLKLSGQVFRFTYMSPNINSIIGMKVVFVMAKVILLNKLSAVL